MFNLVDGSAKFTETMCRSTHMISIGTDGSFSVMNNPRPATAGSRPTSSIMKYTSPV